MSRVAVIGEEAQVLGYLLAGALVFPAEDAAAARAAWRTLPPDVAVAVLTSQAAGWLRDVTGGEAGPPDRPPRRPGVLLVVMPPAEAPAEPGLAARTASGGTPTAAALP
jgi:ATP synthase (F/14-kDa) subunit